jgi:ABC-type phosphate transport system substrate-binding protein
MVGSDTMVNVAQAWAETYNTQHPDAMVQVSGGGSGVGIARLIDGTCDMANASRTMDEKEKEIIKKVVEKHKGNQTRAAGYLHITRPTLIYRMEKYGLKSN